MKKVSHNKTSFRPKKWLGQNFLVNENIQQRIIQSCELTKDDVVLEIGSGLGAITKNIAKHVRQVYAIETDKELYQNLSKQTGHTNINVIHADFLKFNLKKLPKLTKVIGNLPYNISTLIIEKIIDERHLLSQVFITTQLEFAQRLIAKHNSKAYGSLSCFVQYYADTQTLFKISKTSFNPIPKVTSCFTKLSFRKPTIKAQDEKLLFTIIQHAFGQRRKKVINSLASLLEKSDISSILKQLKINEHHRAENLSLQNYIDIANKITSKG